MERAQQQRGDFRNKPYPRSPRSSLELATDEITYPYKSKE